MAKKKPIKIGKTCQCNWGYFVVSAILFTLGLYLVIGGFAAQFQNAAGIETVLVWYFVGILLFAFGKIAKWKTCEDCADHKM